MAKIISAQAYRDEDIVAEKLAAGDFVVTISPAFVVDGEEYQVVLDGHHSLSAAQLAGAQPEFVEADAQMVDSVSLLARGEIDDFLVIHRNDCDYYDIETGACTW